MSIFANSEVNYKSTQLDAAGALSVSEKTLLGNYVIQGDDLPLLIDRVGTGTQTHNFGIVSLSVGVGEYAISQTKQRHLYLAGKSQRVECTFDTLSHVTGVTKKVGYFSSSTTSPYNTAYDGFWLESDGANYNIVIANNGTLTTIPQSSWTDPLDGTGISAKTIDLSKFTIMIGDFLYLGGSSLRVFFKIAGRMVLAHQYNHSNEKTGTIFRSPSQPIRYEIRSTTGTGNFRQICSTVSTEGAVNRVGINRGVEMGDNFVNANTSTNTYLMKAIRLKSTDLHAHIYDFKYSIVGLTADSYLIKVLWNPTIAGSESWVAQSDSSVEIMTGDLVGNPSASTVTGGTLISSQYSYQQGANTQGINNGFTLGSKIDGTSDILAICVQPKSSNLDVSGSLSWLEV